MQSNRITAPWTDEQAAALNRFQTTGSESSYTCRHEVERTHSNAAGKRLSATPAPCGTVLRATPDGWQCFSCGDTQTWAYARHLNAPTWIAELRQAEPDLFVPAPPPRAKGGLRLVK